MASLVDKTGRRFGLLTVINLHSKEPINGSVVVKWNCVCDCGTELVVRYSGLCGGHTRSCGCLKQCTRKGVLRNAFGAYQRNAKKRGYAFELTLEEFLEVVSRQCLYCGTPPQNTARHWLGRRTVFKYSGLDRVDNNLGYSLTNCVPCCIQCNQAKSTYTTKDFIDHCKLVASRN